MGVQESDSKKRSRKQNLKKILLQTVAAAGAISVAFIAPQAIAAMSKLGLLPRKRHIDSLNASSNRLVSKGLLKKQNGFFRLTPAGKASLTRLEAADYKRKKPKKWDKKWRILIFDIPEKRKALREKVRTTLIALGFIRLQDSVWVYPYDCEDLVTLLKADFHIGKDLLYLIVDSIENDSWIRREFSL